MICPTRTEGQEYVCSTCGIRWDFGDEQPECRRGEGAPTVAQVLGATPTKAQLVETYGAEAVRALEPSSWKPSSRDELAARLRKALAMQSGHGQNPIAVAITPNLARDILAELERHP